MKRLLSLVALLSVLTANAQQRQGRPPATVTTTQQTTTPKEDPRPVTSSRVINPEQSVVTNHEVTIRGNRIPYKATTGTLPVWDEEGKPIAGLFYTYYERTDVTDRDSRPLVISFNGGPGSASVWMHLAYTGPAIVKMDDEGYPVQPYGYKDNPYSILDDADIVYIDPVNTGYSRATSKDVPANKFFGVRADIKYLAEWLNTFVTRNNRWASPKFLIGESYGTTRVSGLALELQSNQWMFLNGVILVSPTDLGIERSGPVEAALKLPYFAATAWYHKRLPADLQGKDLTDMLPEVEAFTINELIPAISMGGSITDAKKKEIVAKMAHYTGISEKIYMQNNLDVSPDLFWKELLRDQGYTIGRLDSRYKGIDRADAGDSPDYNAELVSWEHSFTPAINMYIRNELNYKTDLKYNMFGSVYPWDNNGNRTGDNLREAMAQNPYLNLMVQSGYFDGACDYFNAKYSLWQMDSKGAFKDRISWQGYRSGHMMYLRKDDLKTGTEQIREFIKKSLPKPGVAAKY